MPADVNRPVKSVYLMGPLDGCYKIGQSRDPASRARSLGNIPVHPPVLAVITTARRGWLEKYLHAAFRHLQVRGEWFRLGADDIALICGVTTADSPDDLPPALVAMRDRNEAERKVHHNYTTFRIYGEDGDGLRTLARLRRQTIADLVRDLFGETVRTTLLAELEKRYPTTGA